MQKRHDTPTDIGTFMVAVGAVVEHRKTGKILLLQRSVDNFRPNIWEVGYGRLDQGEDPEVGLRREWKEETGIIDLEVVALLSNWHLFRGDATPENELVGMTYWCTTATDAITLSSEHQDFAWVTPEEAMSLVTEPTIKSDIERYVERKKEKYGIAIAQQKEQRALADYNNLQRRTREERTKLVHLATIELVEALLQPLSHLRLASEQIKNQGLEMVVDQLWQVLTHHGLETIAVLGKEFDVKTMEVVEKEDAGEVVTKVVREGYTLNGVVIQHAKVVLGKSNEN